MGQKRRNLKVGDVVLIRDENLARNDWPLARVTEPSDDARVRKVEFLVGDPSLDAKGRRRRSLTYLERPVQKLALLIPEVSPG